MPETGAVHPTAHGDDTRDSLAEAGTGVASSNVVYALTSEGWDVHSATTRVSVASLRASNPETRITIVCDSHTDESVRRNRDPLLQEVDRWLVRETPEGPSVFRNRFLKTRLRRWLDGPFLYLDGDTVVKGSLADVFAVDTDVAAAPNHSADRIADQIWTMDAEVSARMGWTVGRTPFVNGGVIYMRDTTPARMFSDHWHDFWLACVDATGGFRDQPSLNAALSTSRAQLTVLPHRYNAQCRINPAASRGAVIDHYYSAQPGSPTEAERLAAQLTLGAPLTKSGIDALLSSTHPWARRSWLDDLVAARIERRGAIDDLDVLWLEGHRFDSLAIRVREGMPFGRALASAVRRITGARPASERPRV